MTGELTAAPTNFPGRKKVSAHAAERISQGVAALEIYVQKRLDYIHRETVGAD